MKLANEKAMQGPNTKKNIEKKEVFTASGPVWYYTNAFISYNGVNEAENYPAAGNVSLLVYLR